MNIKMCLEKRVFNKKCVKKNSSLYVWVIYFLRGMAGIEYALLSKRSKSLAGYALM